MKKNSLFLTLGFMLSLVWGGCASANNPLKNPKNPNWVAKIDFRDTVVGGEQVGQHAFVSYDGGNNYFQVSWRWTTTMDRFQKALDERVIYVSWSPSGRYLLVMEVVDQPNTEITPFYDTRDKTCHGRSIGIFDTATKTIRWTTNYTSLVSKFCADYFNPKWLPGDVLSYDLLDDEMGSSSTEANGRRAGQRRMTWKKHVNDFFARWSNNTPKAAYFAMQLTKALRSGDDLLVEKTIMGITESTKRDLEAEYQDAINSLAETVFVLKKHKDQWPNISVAHIQPESWSSYEEERAVSFEVEFKSREKNGHLDVVVFLWDPEQRKWDCYTTTREDESAEVESDYRFDPNQGR